MPPWDNSPSIAIICLQGLSFAAGVSLGHA